MACLGACCLLQLQLKGSASESLLPADLCSTIGQAGLPLPPHSVPKITHEILHTPSRTALYLCILGILKVLLG